MNKGQLLEWLEEAQERARKFSKAEGLPYIYPYDLSDIRKFTQQKGSAKDLLRQALRERYTFGAGPISPRWRKESYPEDIEEMIEFPEIGVVVVLSPRKWMSPYPSPEDFRPELHVNRGRDGKLYVKACIQSRYQKWSSHPLKYIYRTHLSYMVKDESIYFLVKYRLHRGIGDTRKSVREFTYLFGIADSSPFVTRVSPNVDSVEEALEWMKPAEVRKAEEEGRTVLRQGDVFFVELRAKTKKITDYTLPSNHHIVHMNGKAVIAHHEHSYLELPHPHFKPVVRKEVTVEGVGRFSD